ncbi:MAG: phosphatidylinositol kinase [Acidobacteriales bacterium]|nr:phosphatidylinositol kinase [Terriglobales bacterium]
MRASDSKFYIVKFQNNPQHVRVLANELIATRLAEHIGLPTAPCDVLDVGSWLIEKTPELHIQVGRLRTSCKPGLQFGSRYIVDPVEGQVLDYMPEPLLCNSRVRNPEAFVGALVFDKWTCNADGRQVIYWRHNRERKYSVALVDQGHCFNAGDWAFPDSPLRGTFTFNCVYQEVCGWQSFEPWLSRLEHLDQNVLWNIAESVPPEWYEGNWKELEALVDDLVGRRKRVRELVAQFAASSRNPFPNWNSGVKRASGTS